MNADINRYFKTFVRFIIVVSIDFGVTVFLLVKPTGVNSSKLMSSSCCITNKLNLKFYLQCFSTLFGFKYVPPQEELESKQVSCIPSDLLVLC